MFTFEYVLSFDQVQCIKCTGVKPSPYLRSDSFINDNKQTDKNVKI